MAVGFHRLVSRLLAFLVLNDDGLLVGLVVEHLPETLNQPSWSIIRA